MATTRGFAQGVENQAVTTAIREGDSGPSAYSIGAWRSMSSWQCRGGGGSSSGATRICTSVPHNEHRYIIRTRRSSPAGGGSGMGRARLPSMNMPTRMMINPAPIAITILSANSTLPA